MDLDQLITFMEVAKQGSFSRAGQKVFRSQPAVSAQIRQLEEEYSEKLFDRSGKLIRLTPAGEVLLEYARRMLTLRAESQRAVADQRQTPRGTLAFGANEATCLYVLPDVLARYHSLYPKVRISVYRNFSHKILEKIEDGWIDLGIVTLPASQPSLEVMPIFRDRLMLMVSTKHPLAKRSSVRVSEAAEHPLIFPKTGYTRQVLDKLFRPYRSRLVISMELASVGMIKRFVAANLGASLISASYANEEVRAGEAKLIALQGVDAWRELGLVYRRDRTLPRAVTAFIQLMSEQKQAAPA
ncbi:MAG: LysR family transcriptional regulator [Terriglobales bacterium]